MAVQKNLGEGARDRKIDDMLGLIYDDTRRKRPRWLQGWLCMQERDKAYHTWKQEIRFYLI